MSEISGPNRLAAQLEADIAGFLARRDAATTKAERRHCNQAIHRCRQMLGWCKTRAGYVKPTA